MQKIQLSIKSTYGNQLIYPMCETALKLAKLAGKKTLNGSDIKTIRELGYQVVLVEPQENLEFLATI